MISDTPRPSCRHFWGSNLGHLCDIREYSGLYYNDKVVLEVLIVQLVWSMDLNVKNEAWLRRQYRDCNEIRPLMGTIPTSAIVRERSYDDMRLSTRTTDCTPHGLERVEVSGERGKHLGYGGAGSDVAMP